MARRVSTHLLLKLMAILDAPTYAAQTSTTGAERIVAVSGGKEVGLPLNGINGLLSGDVDASVADTDVIATRLAVVVGTTPTVTLPAVAGDLREVFIINTASGTATVDGAGSEQILTAAANADNITVATGKTARLLSDGTRWYHVSNDA